MPETTTVRHGRHENEIMTPTAASPGGVVHVVCKCGESFTIDNPAGNSDEGSES